ncbi:MAG: hypothetical protein ACK5IP_13525 [Paracoccus sp. (in: a-proteobacteria)]
MRKPAALAAIAALGFAVAGCTQNINPTDTDRALIGAAAGATIAAVGDKKDSTIIKYGAIGAAGGALCDDVRLCQ